MAVRDRFGDDRSSASEPASRVADTVTRRDHPTRTPLADAAAIAASREDPAAFTVVFDRHYDAIAGFLRRRLEASLADEPPRRRSWRRSMAATATT